MQRFSKQRLIFILSANYKVLFIHFLSKKCRAKNAQKHKHLIIRELQTRSKFTYLKIKNISFRISKLYKAFYKYYSELKETISKQTSQTIQYSIHSFFPPIPLFQSKPPNGSLSSYSSFLCSLQPMNSGLIPNTDNLLPQTQNFHKIECPSQGFFIRLKYLHTSSHILVNIFCFYELL